LPDGIGVRIASGVLGGPVRENVNGTDLLPRLCSTLQKSGHSLFLLGARPGVASEMARRLLRQYPELKIAGTCHGYFDHQDETQIARSIRRSGADVVLTALGAPRQDVFNEEQLEEMGVRVAIGVGGLFDFYSGRIRRAPEWVRELGFEWLFRLVQEPRRLWRRYVIGNVEFLFRVGLTRVAERSST
jgi:N-acetylglucosaminyldiphosphoundecaprenol N-acetyl-beta-D-mannosaminyltransferase